MPDANDKIDRLTAYLETLPPSVVETLAEHLDRARAAGDDEPGNDIILDAVRAVCRRYGAKLSRHVDGKRAFFDLFDPFLVDDQTIGACRGRLYRGHLDAIWAWLTGDEHTIAFRVAVEAIDAAGPADGDGPDIDQITDMHRVAAECIRAALERTDGNERDRRRFTGLIGGADALQSLFKLQVILDLRGQIAGLEEALPDAPVQLDEDLAAFLAQRLMRVDAEKMAFLARIVMQRLGSPAQILEVVLLHEGTDDMDRIVQSPLAPLVDIVIEDLVAESLALERFNGSLQDIDHFIDRLRRFALISSGLTRYLDLDEHDGWRARVGSCRRQVSDLVRRPVERALPSLHKFVAGLVGGGTVKRRDDPAETRDLVRIVFAMRHFRSELALNELLTRISREIEDFVDTSSRAATARFRALPDDEHAALLPDFDIFLEICAIVVGDTYAASLRRSAGLTETVQVEQSAA